MYIKVYTLLLMETIFIFAYLCFYKNIVKLRYIAILNRNLKFKHPLDLENLKLI